MMVAAIHDDCARGAPAPIPIKSTMALGRPCRTIDREYDWDALVTEVLSGVYELELCPCHYDDTIGSAIYLKLSLNGMRHLADVLNYGCRAVTEETTQCG